MEIKTKQFCNRIKIKSRQQNKTDSLNSVSIFGSCQRSNDSNNLIEWVNCQNSHETIKSSWDSKTLFYSPINSSNSEM